jgi:hypothetical protein
MSAPAVTEQPAFMLFPATSLEGAGLLGSQAVPRPQSAGAANPNGFSPAQVRTAYGIAGLSLGGITGNGAGQTIAIVDAYDDPRLVDSSAPGFGASDLAHFDQQYGIPAPPNFFKLNEYGGTILPGTDPAGAGSARGNWELEEALDVEWAHAIAPAAGIVLVECNSANSTDMYRGVTTAAATPGVSVISMSWGSSEYGAEQSYDGTFTTPVGHQGVTFVAATGDAGSPGQYPAISPNVVAVGGTSLVLNPDNSYHSEKAWSGSGGGVSVYEIEPAYQGSSQQSGTRTIPDVSFDADPNTGVSVYDSYNGTSSHPWDEVGGTSLAAPSWAGLIAIADEGRVASGGTTLDGPGQTLPALYSLSSSDVHDIISGSNGGHSAGPGYDLVTGLGSPVANRLVPDLAGYGIAYGLKIVNEPPVTVAAGTPFGLTAWVENSQGGLETSFDGIVSVSLASDPGGGTLGGTTSVMVHNGVAAFAGLSLSRAGFGYTLSVSAGGPARATTNPITVTPAAPARLVVVSEPPSQVNVAAPFGVVVAVEDIYGNLEPNVGGQVSFRLASEPGRAALGGTLSVAINQGLATFSNLTLSRAGSGFTLVASDPGLAPAKTTPLGVVAQAGRSGAARTRVVHLRAKHAAVHSRELRKHLFKTGPARPAHQGADRRG